MVLLRVLLVTMAAPAATVERPTQARHHCSSTWPNGHGNAPARRAHAPTAAPAFSTGPSPRAGHGLAPRGPRGGACNAGFCVGPPRCYPTDNGPGGADLVWEAEFDVPPLPATFDPSSMTDYIYFNLVFGYGTSARRHLATRCTLHCTALPPHPTHCLQGTCCCAHQHTSPTLPPMPTSAHSLTLCLAPPLCLRCSVSRLPANLWPLALTAHLSAAP